MTAFRASALVGLLLAGAAVAAPPTKDELPPALREWTSWVLHGQEDQLCPSFDGDEARNCVWPGRLALSLDAKSGRFMQSFSTFKESLVALPGDAKRWPQNVKVDGKDAVVLEVGGEPHVRLGTGEHTVAGEFFWDALPESIDIPEQTGLLSLTVKGKEVLLPNRTEGGEVFLQKEAEAEEETENVELQIHRAITDEVPLLLATHLQLNVSGKSRELLLGKALPDGFVPMSISSSLPVRLESDGKLRVQARAGSWTIDLLARHEGPVAALSRPKTDALWTEGDEVWVFDARPHLRQVLVEGVNAVDPNQTTLPDAWKRLPAYAVSPSDTFKLTERRRGDADPAPDVLRLSRTMWLDFDGAGYTVNDRISGALHRSWRLEMQAPTELGRVVASGADQFITRLASGKPAGVELRQGIINLEADSRIVGDRSDVPAVSWDADFHQVSGVLNLPPGWRLFHASGADEVPGTWIRGWSLLDLFLVLVIALAVGRLFGWAWGALALITLTLTFPESDSPQYVWLFVLAAEALVRLLPQGWLKTLARVFRFGAWAALVLITVPFLVQHLRQGMYPALEHEWQQMGGVQTFTAYQSENLMAYSRSSSTVLNNDIGVQGNALDQAGEFEGAFGFKDNAPGGMAFAPAPTAQAEMKPDSDEDDRKFVSKKGMMKEQWAQQNIQTKRSFNVQDYDKNAMVQTGPGLPRWSWTSISIGFSGPVERSQRLQLWLLSPTVNLILAFLRVLLLCALVLVTLNFPGTFWPESWKRPVTPPAPPKAPTPAAARVSLFARLRVHANAVALVLGLFAGAGRVLAQETPSADVLEQLRTRLLERPQCEPNCATSPRLSLEATRNQLTLRFEVHAAAQTAVPLPGNAQHWVPTQVMLDGKPANGMSRDDEGTLWLVVGPGSHQVVLSGPMPPRDTVQLPLPMKSHRVEAKTDGWTLDGLHEDGLADENLQLSRVATGGEKVETGALETGNLPPFVTVTRELVLGLQWTVNTTVQRVTPTGSAVVLEVPLLAGESITTQDMRVQNGKALVNMGPAAQSVSWSSVLDQKSPIALKAPSGVAWVEVWRLDVSPIWHVSLSGIPVIHQQDASGVRLPEWHPWPGETVTVEVTRPEGVSGQTLTIDQSQLRVNPGLRATDVTLTANLRSSRGGQHTFTLPEDAQLQTVIINGQSQPIRQEGRKVSIPLVPGSQSVELTWRQSAGLGSAWKTPEVDMGTRTANADLTVNVPADRWVLLVNGPRMGPAVLFWSLLLVLVLVGVGLGRISLTPLKTFHWVLLMVGLSQVAVPLAAIVVGWLLLLGWRKKQVEFGKGVAWYDLRQLFLAGASVVAMGVLIASIHQGLLGNPDMQITGNGSSAAYLHWYQDRTADLLPRGWILSVPRLVYRGAMLAWSLWLALALLRWLKWGWSAFSEGGVWRMPPKIVKPVPSGPSSPPPAAGA